MAYANDEEARDRQYESQVFFYNGREYEIGWKSVVIYDDMLHAEWLASELGTQAFHAPAKQGQKLGWETFSVVGLPYVG